MKITINFIRVFVGVLFIFSGLVKANDPLGTAYKMEEYFEVWNADLLTTSFFLKDALVNLFHFFNGHTLFLSITMNAFEIIAGAALLLGWRMRLFAWLLLLLMIFFTILTGYTFQTGRPTNCGCFGDCIKITPQFSFWKDVLLTVLILVILFAKKHIKPLLPPLGNTISMVLVIIFSFGLQWYALKYLPPVDCLPFKKGNNIVEKMKIPADAVPDSIAMTFVYEKQGKEIEFTADKFPDDFSDSLYKFIKRYDKLIRKGKNNEPPIKGFSLSDDNNVDWTSAILNLPYVVLFFEENPAEYIDAWENEFKKIVEKTGAKNIPLFVVTKSSESFKEKRHDRLWSPLTILRCDFTAIRTASRSKQTIYILKKGVVEGKWSFANFDKAAAFVEEVPDQPAELNNVIRSVSEANYTIQKAEQEAEKMQEQADSLQLIIEKNKSYIDSLMNAIKNN